MGKCWVSITFFVILCTVAKSEAGSLSDSCLTHNDKPGSCIRMRDCEQLLYQMKQYTNRLHASKFLKKSHCGVDKYGPLFCCPLDTQKNTKRMVFNVIESTREPNKNKEQTIGGNPIISDHAVVAWPIIEEHWYGRRIAFSPLALFSKDQNGIRCYYFPNLSNPFQTGKKRYTCVCYSIKQPVEPSSSTTVFPTNPTTDDPNPPTSSTFTEAPITPTTSANDVNKTCNCSVDLTVKPTRAPATTEISSTPSTTEIPSTPSMTTDDTHYPTTITTTTTTTTTEDPTTTSTTTEDPGGFYRRQLPTPPHCGKSKVIVNRVVGGSPAIIGKWPWMVALGYKNIRQPDIELDWKCGGSLITDRHVLTAAHCLERYHPGLTLVMARMGVVDLDKNSTAVPVDVLVDKKVGHEDFEFHVPYTNDIAILTLKTPVECNDRIQPICLPFSSAFKDERFSGKHPFVAGWGKLEEGDWGGSSRMMEAQVPVVNHTTCQEGYRSEFELSQTQLCAGNEEKDSCQGDSGGPLMYPLNQSYYIIGINSFGKGCAEAGYPGIYTRVTAYMDWIKDKLAES